MAKQFFTEHDIEDMVKRGTQSLEINDQVVLTDLAYERARKLGLNLMQGKENPPSAPVRPYVSQQAAIGGVPSAYSPAGGSKEADLHKRVREAVLTRLGNQVDANLLDTIIARSLKAVGIK